MLKNKIFRRLSLLVSLVMLLTSTVNTTFGLIVTKTESLINTFTPESGIVNDLLISKAVEHPLGEGYVIPDHISFDFEVNFGSLYANTTMKTTAGDLVADASGSIKVSVKPGQVLGVEGIDAGTKVTVTEVQQDGSGFAVKDGTVTKEAIVAEDGSVKIDFANVYTPAGVQPVNVTVGGTKILEGREWQSGDTFSFTLEQKTGEDTWVALGTETITYEAGNEAFNQFDFSDIVQALTFERVGTYTFRMTEIAGDLEQMDYDKSINTFAIKVTDVDMDGKLEVGNVTAAQNAAVTEADGGFQVSVTFNNTFIPAIPDPDDIAVAVTVNKTVKNTGVDSIGPEGFEFMLENTGTGEKLALRSDADGKAIFTLPFTAADIGKTYTYKLSETDEGVAGMTYDAKVYDISVAIALGEDNRLIAAVTMDGETVDSAVAVFENIYHTELPVPEDIAVAVTVNKTVKNTGDGSLGPEGFEFVLENTATGEKLALRSGADGKAVFSLPFTAENIGKTYTYKLSETNGGAEGVTYDTTVYEISVAITLGEDNRLIAALTVNGSAVDSLTAEFENTYYVAPPDIPTGESGRNVFWFMMMIASGAACVALLWLDRKYERAGKNS